MALGLTPLAVFPTGLATSAQLFRDSAFLSGGRHAQEAAKSGWEVELQAGDQLFIPEGWWHQVDSTHRTAAVNFWWESDFTANLGSWP
jgi:hypothetical protein